MNAVSLRTIQRRYRKIAAALDSDSSLPTTPQHDGSPHAEHQADTYFYVVTERGNEWERRTTNDPDELLSWFVRGLTGELAGTWELANRVPHRDSRRLRFQRHVELLRGIRPEWAEAQHADYEAVLAEHPFDDSSSDRVDYIVELRDRGVENEEAIRLGYERFPDPSPMY